MLCQQLPSFILAQSSYVNKDSLKEFEAPLLKFIVDTEVSRIYLALRPLKYKNIFINNREIRRKHKSATVFFLNQLKRFKNPNLNFPTY